MSEHRMPEEVIRHYRDEFDEDQRLAHGLGELELLRTREIVCRHLPDGPLRVLDVGGATGVHAAWLAEDGHRVHVLDPVATQVARVVESPGARAGRITAEVGDARRLPFEEASFDAVLLLGPLYHLTEREERLTALAEARRVVRPGGPVFAAAISRFASLFDGLARGLLFEPGFEDIVERDLRDGQHRNPTGHPRWFTTAYFHHPDELEEELRTSGLHVREVLGVEGLAGWLEHLADRWADQAAREAILRSARVVEADACLRGLSAHLLGVAARPA
ncbi:MAG TPA: methyltransferase domain-containing protein [Candidatus Dormibacteraeota bacterium]|nr:methyltransferase domain-containing protein [Candidatus Dormibacteraeota bacterium]